MTLRTMQDVDLAQKRVMIREDFNVPIENGKITSDARLQAALPTIQFALKANAKIILLSHLGRPEEGAYDDTLSLELVADQLAQLLDHPVRFEKNWLDGISIDAGEIVLCENVRFNKGEKKDDEVLAKKMANLCDVFVMDAFATAHRAEASTHGIAKFAPIACAGPLLAKELSALAQSLTNPQRPLIAIVGGSKVSTKLMVLESLLNKVDQLIVGGGIANTFLAAKGFNIGKSLVEIDLIDQAKKLLAFAAAKNVEILLPQDVMVTTNFSKESSGKLAQLTEIQPDDMILDVGPRTSAHYSQLLQQAKTIIWNGPVGVFEFPAFMQGTKSLALAIAASPAFSLAGGGDTIAAIEQFQITDKISYISTGGGAFLEFIEGRTLPAVEILTARASS